ncbi:hypothetical protein ACE193_08410 [Bernardetia sp. OM2101]|uniref:hypothetical protein n=1 Tax=Bernardetia sp. OM2101 TaxID=3344876 RepID=UPI0035CFF457
MIKYFTIVLLGLFAVLSSCTEAQEDVSTEQLLEEIKEIEAQLSDKTSDKVLNQEEKIVFWKDELNKDKYTSDRVANARINYIIGKNFASLSIYSAEMYATKALILIDDVEGFENKKTDLYNGYLLKISIQKGEKSEADYSTGHVLI